MPVSFNIRPREAVKLIQKKYNERCYYKFGYEIYADRVNYYIVKRSLSPDIKYIKKYAYKVNGKTGNVSKD